MKKLLILVILGALAWNIYLKSQRPPASPSIAAEPPATIDQLVATTAPSFTCDGRLHCSQMKSCEEAKYFLQHCPGVKMDGDHDGIPCERMCQ